jgi:hypothetical protein
MRMKRTLFFLLLAAALPAAGQDMRPNKEPVPSPSELRSNTGEDRPQGQAREARTPSPSDLATETPRVDGDRPTSAIQDPRNAGVGVTRPAPSPSDLSSPRAPAR